MMLTEKVSNCSVRVSSTAKNGLEAEQGLPTVGENCIGLSMFVKSVAVAVIGVVCRPENELQK